MSSVFSEEYSDLSRTLAPFEVGTSRVYMDLVQTQIKKHYGLTALAVLLDNVISSVDDRWYISDASEDAVANLARSIFSIGLSNAGVDYCDWFADKDEDGIVVIDTQRDCVGKVITEEALETVTA